MNNKKTLITIFFILIVSIAIILGLELYKSSKEYKLATQNLYNYAFYEFINYVDSMETYLAKSTISTSSKYGAETLTYVWREANLAQNYLSQIPITNKGLSNASKFLNQVSDYSYSLSRKNINNEELTQEELDNLTQLHEYSVQLKNALNELTEELNNGSISWKELTKETGQELAQQVSNITLDSFNTIEETFHDYTGLIYDGAFSEHMTNPERKGLTGDEIDEERATQITRNFIGDENIKEIESKGLSENGNIQSYTFSITLNNENEENKKIVSISKKGGHIVYINFNRLTEKENISIEEANKIGLEFLNNKGYSNMKQTYYIKEQGILTINYAYEEDKIICYPDLIKLKIALDDGDILGMEATGYLNCHYERQLTNNIIDKEEAKEKINNNLEITNERLAIIPTEFNTEIYCWEFQGKVGDNEFLVYVNAETGKEEDILVIINTPNGIMTT